MTAAASEKSALDWLYSTQLFGVKLGLDNTHRLLGAMGLPAANQQFIHVAGTNGKGSTCAFAHSILRAAGIPAGLFTSPHLVHFRERICDHERMISSEELVRGIEQLRALVQDWDPHPTFFELTFALALDWFRQRELPWVLLETGLGGRLDATNAIVPAVAVITAIGHDHLELLGPTLADVAWEKGGIIKPGIPVITGPQPEGVVEVLQKVAGERGAPWIAVTAPAAGPLGLEGPHQPWNAALALKALEAAGVLLSSEVISRGLREAKWRGRFERVGPNDRLILDGAHNPEAARALVSTWNAAFPEEKARVLFGAVQGKDVSEVLRTLDPIVEDWHFVTMRSPRAIEGGLLAGELKRFSDKPTITHATVAAGLAYLWVKSERILATGSLYLVGEVLSELDPGLVLEVSAQ